MSRVLLGPICILICWRLGDWRSWRKYYSTILFCIIGDLTCNFLTCNKPLWMYGGTFWNHTMADLYLVVFVFPCVIIMFFTYYPSELRKQIVYILGWSLFLSTVEFISFRMGNFFYHNGWNICFTILFDFTALVLIRIHYKNPIIAWPIAMVLAFATLFIFKIPFSGMK